MNYFSLAEILYINLQSEICLCLRCANCSHAFLLSHITSSSGPLSSAPLFCPTCSHWPESLWKPHVLWNAIFTECWNWRSISIWIRSLWSHFDPTTHSINQRLSDNETSTTHKIMMLSAIFIYWGKEMRSYETTVFLLSDNRLQWHFCVHF